MAGYTPARETLDLLVTSGNAINGLGEREPRRPSPFFWHDPALHPFGALQQAARASVRRSPAAAEQFRRAYEYPPLVEVAPPAADLDAATWTVRMREFALAHEADLAGVAAMQPQFVFEGFAITHPTVVVLALGHDYEALHACTNTADNSVGIAEVGRQYARGTRASYALANWIRAQGYEADPYPGPLASALVLIPAAIAAGLGELGKHGSLINRHHGSGLRLAGVTTTMPLVPDHPDTFGADDFCTRCRICERACPPAAIADHKQWVRGVERWYVDFDRCIPYFAENASCGICFTVCPWTRPQVRPTLLAKMARRRGDTPPAGTDH